MEEEGETKGGGEGGGEEETRRVKTRSSKRRRRRRRRKIKQKVKGEGRTRGWLIRSRAGRSAGLCGMGNFSASLVWI